MDKEKRKFNKLSCLQMETKISEKLVKGVDEDELNEDYEYKTFKKRGDISGHSITHLYLHCATNDLINEAAYWGKRLPLRMKQPMMDYIIYRRLFNKALIANDYGEAIFHGTKFVKECTAETRKELRNSIYEGIELDKKMAKSALNELLDTSCYDRLFHLMIFCKLNQKAVDLSRKYLSMAVDSDDSKRNQLNAYRYIIWGQVQDRKYSDAIKTCANVKMYNLDAENGSRFDCSEAFNTACNLNGRDRLVFDSEKRELEESVGVLLIVVNICFLKGIAYLGRRQTKLATSWFEETEMLVGALEEEFDGHPLLLNAFSYRTTFRSFGLFAKLALIEFGVKGHKKKAYEKVLKEKALVRIAGLQKTVPHSIHVHLSGIAHVAEHSPDNSDNDTVFQMKNSLMINDYFMHLQCRNKLHK